MTIKSVLPLLNFSGKKSTVKQMTMIIKFIITRILTRKNCFRYLKLMSPLNVAICTTISYTLWVEWYYLKNNYLTLKVITVPDTPPYGHVPTYQISLTYLERQKCYGPDKKILFKKQFLTLRSKSHEDHYGMRHTALWSCTHIPNIIDLSGKTKKLWSGQALLRRSRRKNQTKTICLPSFEGET